MNNFIKKFAFVFCLMLCLNPLCKAMLAEDNDEHKVVRILSIDGGGIRGLIPAQILQHLEDQLLISFAQKIHIAEYFDIIAGTSTGGIIALGLTDKKNGEFQDAKEVVKLYQTHGSTIFPSASVEWLRNIVTYFKPTHDVGPLEALLEERFGDSYFKNLSTQVLITAYEMHGNTPFIFDSHDEKYADFLTKSVGRATSAAPTFLKPALTTVGKERYGFLDGGIFANNPTLLAVQNAQKRFPKAKHFQVISLGTGEEAPDNLFDKLENSGQIAWAGPLISFMMSSNCKLVEESVLSIKSTCESMGGKFDYVRIQPALSKEQSTMDNSKTTNVDALLGVARKETSGLKVAQALQFLKGAIVEKGYQLINDIGNDHIQSLTLQVQLGAYGDSLDLKESDVSNEDLGLIAKLLKDNQSLTEIDLSHNHINGLGATSLQKILIQNPNINRMILDDNNFGSNGTQSLESCLKGTPLRYLSLKQTKLVDNDVLPLLRLMNTLPALNINLEGIQITNPQTLKLLNSFVTKERVTLNNQ